MSVQMLGKRPKPIDSFSHLLRYGHLSHFLQAMSPFVVLSLTKNFIQSPWLSDQIASTTLNMGAASVTNSLLRRETDSGKTILIQTDTVDHLAPSKAS
jgi:hypothetical protein